MSALTIGTTFTLSLGVDDLVTIATNGGFATVTGTQITGQTVTGQFGPGPQRRTFGPYSQGATLVLSNQSAPSMMYDVTSGAAGGAASVVVAPSNSDFKSRADVVLRGTADQVEINGILASNTTSRSTFKTVLLGGTYSLTDEIIINQHNTCLEGEGFGFWGAFTTAGGSNPGQGIEGVGVTKLKQTVTGKNIIRIDNTTNVGVDTRLHGVTISKLYLYGFNYTGTGILSNDSGHDGDQFIIQNVFIHKTLNGIDLFADTPHILSNTMMDIGGVGVIVRGSVYGLIWDNIIADNAGDGIQLLGGGGASVSKNVLVRVARGIYSTASGPQIENNTIVDLRGAAIQTTGFSPRLTGNVISTIQGVGILLDTGSSQATIVGNSVVATTSHGVHLKASATMTGNNVNTTTGKGVFAASGSEGSVITGNQISNAADELATLAANDVNFSSNTVSSNSTTQHGISVSGLACLVNANRIVPTVTCSGTGLYAAGNSNIMVTSNYVIGGGSFASKLNLPVHNGTTIVNANNM